MKGIVTINTDAGWYPHDKVGSFAYWIKADGLHLHGSGVFKELCTSSTDAELKAMINAVHVLKASGYKHITKIIFNRDNIKAKSGKRGNANQQLLYKMLRKMRDESIKLNIIKGIYPFYEFRHVKAHSDGADKRSYVNNWCDQQCKMRLKEWKQQQKTQS